MCPSNKKFAVVTFISENTVEVIPTIWLISKAEAKWPNINSKATIVKYIKDCTPPGIDWITNCADKTKWLLK